MDEPVKMERRVNLLRLNGSGPYGCGAGRLAPNAKARSR